MELNQYLRLLRKWWWLIAVAAFIGGGVSFIIRTQQPPVYQAETLIAIGSFIDSRNPNQAEINVAVDLVETYAQLLRTTDILESTIDALNLDMSNDRLRSLIDTNVLPGTTLLVVGVTYTDAILAADIANTLSDQLILNSPSNLTPDQQAQITFATNQIESLTLQIADAQADLEAINAQLDGTQIEAERNRLTEQRNTLVEQINQATATVAQFTDTISRLQQNSNSLEIVDSARVPTSPSGRSSLFVTLIGAVAAAGLAVAGTFAYEYLDETLRTTEDVAQALTLPILGAIMKIGKKSDTYHQRLISNMPSMSPAAEGYRTIRTNLLFGTGDRGDTGIYIVTSPGPEEGKSITTANLAISMAMAGLQVLLIDADLRRPKVHEVFDLDNTIGLTTLLSAEPREALLDGENVPSRHLPTNLLDCIQTTPLAKLWVITSGFTPANPTEILGSTLLQRWIQIFKQSSDIDIVLIDTPPTLLVADSTVLAATAQSNVILVVDCGHTRRAAAIRAKEQFQQLGIEIKGVVANRINPRDQGYDYGYGYTYYYAPRNVESLNGSEQHQISNQGVE